MLTFRFDLPHSLGFVVWSTAIFAVAQCQIEMVSLLPVDGSFIRFAGRFVDESYGMAAGYNVSCIPAAAEMGLGS